MKYYKVFYFLLLLGACSGPGKKSNEVETPLPEEKIVDVPKFNGDSAFQYVKKQVDFGPRVPGSEGHANTATYLIEQLSSYGAKITTQEFSATTFDNKQLSLTNIVGSLFPEKQKRILLAAHWDTRPFADKDTERIDEPIEGANDGASGVAVLLEIARVLSTSPPDVGIDIIFFDGEDWGDKYNSGHVPTPDTLESWYCLGSQYWAKNKHKKNYSAYYGILLDMVGAQGSQFRKEGLSVMAAPKVVDRIWQRAASLGYSNFFVNKTAGAITDDHQFVNDPGKIPMVNIVHYDPVHGYFGDYHHTHRDNLSIIDKEILKIVGETVLHVIYHE